MFEGKAEEAITFYVSLFPDGRIIDVTLYGPGQAGPESSVKVAASRRQAEVMCIDSPAKHAFTFTPAFSLFVDSDSEEDIRRLSTARRGRGRADAVGSYGFSRQFTWLNDRYGVSWQLNLPECAGGPADVSRETFAGDFELPFGNRPPSSTMPFDRPCSRCQPADSSP